MNLNVFWACILLIALFKVYISAKANPALLPIVTRAVWVIVVVLLLTAALMADDGDAATNVISRGHACAGGWLWCPW